MDADQLAILARRFIATGSRRGFFGASLGFATAQLAGLTSQAKQRKKKCKNTCGPCDKCKKGKCKSISPGREACGGRCLPVYLDSPDLVVVRNPLTCDSCVASGQTLGAFCPIGDVCCASDCSEGACAGIAQGGVCAFDAQCASGNCVLGECA